MDHQKLRACVNEILELPEEDFLLLLSCATSRELKKGEHLLREREICHCFYFVDKGYLRTYYNKDGSVVNLNFTFEGNFTTNVKSYRSRIPSELNIEAGEDASVWIFSFRNISGYFTDRAQISRFVRRLAINLLLAAEEHSDLFKIYTPTERYRYIEKNNPKLLQRISLSQMASYLGVTRETLSRIRAKND